MTTKLTLTLREDEIESSVSIIWDAKTVKEGDVWDWLQSTAIKGIGFVGEEVK